MGYIIKQHPPSISRLVILLLIIGFYVVLFRSIFPN